MKAIFHAMFGSLLLAMISIFFVASLVTQYWYAGDEVASVKLLVLQGFFWLIPILVVTGLLGLSLAKHRQGIVIESKKKRMLWILLICIAILFPAAYTLSAMAQKGEFDLLYFLIQAFEYVFDFITLTLLGLNFRDGVQLVAIQAAAPGDKISE